MADPESPVADQQDEGAGARDASEELDVLLAFHRSAHDDQRLWWGRLTGLQRGYFTIAVAILGAGIAVKGAEQVVLFLPFVALAFYLWCQDQHYCIEVVDQYLKRRIYPALTGYGRENPDPDYLSRETGVPWGWVKARVQLVEALVFVAPSVYALWLRRGDCGALWTAGVVVVTLLVIYSIVTVWWRPHL